MAPADAMSANMDQRVPASMNSNDVGAADRSLKDDARQLADDARALAEAELAYQLARARFAGKGATRIAIFVAIAVVLLIFALLAATVGTVIALVPILSAWGAMAAVAGGLTLVAAIFALLAVSLWRRVKAALFGNGGAHE